MRQKIIRRRLESKPVKESKPPKVGPLAVYVEETATIDAPKNDDLTSFFEALVTRGGFANVNQATFVQVLRSIGAADLVEQTPEGVLIAGILGEKIIRSRDFYAAFTVHEEYKVNHVAHHVGNIPMNPTFQVDGYLILAGRRWKILDIDHEGKVITVAPSPAGRIPRFSSHEGQDIHPRVRETMKSLLERTDIPVYIDLKAREMLIQARLAARDAGILNQTFLQDGVDVFWFTWTGTRIQRTLEGLGRYFAKLDIVDENIALVFKKTTVAKVREVYRSFLESPPDAETIARRFPMRCREKYEGRLSDDLTARIFAKERLDVPETFRLIQTDC